MYEYKTEKVDPSSQQNVINAYALFGWELVSSNETYHESTEITGVHTDVRSYGEFMQGFTGKDGVATTQYDTVTHVTNFVTLQFRRETTMPHYAQLTALEQEFEATNYPRFTKKAPSRTAAVVLTVVAAIAFAILAISLIQALVVPVEIESSDYIIIAILCAVIVIACSPPSCCSGATSVTRKSMRRRRRTIRKSACRWKKSCNRSISRRAPCSIPEHTTT